MISGAPLGQGRGGEGEHWMLCYGGELSFMRALVEVAGPRKEIEERRRGRGCDKGRSVKCLDCPSLGGRFQLYASPFSFLAFFWGCGGGLYKA